MTATALDPERRRAFVRRVLADSSASMVTTLAVIGDRLGLFRALAAGGPATSAELAERAGIVERYAREWLGGMAAAGYLEYDPGTRRFTLPPEHAAALADEGGPYFYGGVHEMLAALTRQLDGVAAAFREGGGVAQRAYGQDTWEGMERFSAGWVENALVGDWLPRLPDVEAMLRAGARVADVGCGGGRALCRLAQAFPASTYTGYDVFAPAIERARENARAAGVEGRVRFEQVDAGAPLPGPHDLITTFDVVHDAADPLGLLRAIRAALAPGGVYVCLDMNCSDRVEENTGPVGSMLHGISVLYCLTTSLAQGGAGLGALGLSEPVLRELCAQAGFSSVRQVDIRNLFNNLYEIRP
ncbi:MAG TPA: class I SAM-dependent methyltransferase [Candidatus Dormibacteraeota bacterium]|jgi:SAM-dependent methyltransferase|nr:class I SAM-dependent methyltransferase [Candidatus Dormibacteraeota bacterium]